MLCAACAPCVRALAQCFHFCTVERCFRSAREVHFNDSPSCFPHINISRARAVEQQLSIHREEAADVKRRHEWKVSKCVLRVGGLCVCVCCTCACACMGRYAHTGLLTGGADALSFGWTVRYRSVFAFPTAPYKLYVGLPNDFQEISFRLQGKFGGRGQSFAFRKHARTG